MVVATRTERHRADPKKSGGVVYTPPELARFLAIQAFDALGPTAAVRILDPACGDGELLLAAAGVAGERGIVVEALVGYDVDGEAVRLAEGRLVGFSGVEFIRGDFLDVAATCDGQVSLLDPLEDDRRLDFDLVISNPPYVRTQTLGSKAAQILGEKYGLTGRVDLYQVFAVAMIQALRSGGALGLLCSNKFLTNRAGTSMRRVLLEELEIAELVDLGDTKLFDAAVLPVIVSGRGSTDRSDGVAPFRSVYTAKQRDVSDASPVTSVLSALSDRVGGIITSGDEAFAIRDGVLDLSAGPSLPWNPMDESTRASFGILLGRNLAVLGEVGKIRVGVKTTADSVFIRSDWDDLPEEIRPELELLRPLITHRDIDSWACRPGERRILYPHRDNGGRAAPIALDEFPRAAAYLERHRERLESRTYLEKSSRKWFEIWVPQKPALWERRKVVFPDIADVPRFAVDESGSVVNGDCYWIEIDDPDVAEVVTAVGNSTFCTWFYDAACGNFLYAGRRGFMTQYIERLPIPDPTPELAEHIRSLRSEDALDVLDDLIWDSVGLEKVLR